MSGPRELLDQFDALRAAGTAGPWDAEICEGELTVSAGSARTTWTDHDGFRLGTSPSSYRTTDRIYEHQLDDWDADSEDDRQREADADLIVAAVNALPHLVTALRATLALADDLEDVAHDYRHAAAGSHDAGARNAHTAIAKRLRSNITAALSPAQPQSGNPA